MPPAWHYKENQSTDINFVIDRKDNQHDKQTIIDQHYLRTYKRIIKTLTRRTSLFFFFFLKLPPRKTRRARRGLMTREIRADTAVGSGGRYLHSSECASRNCYGIFLKFAPCIGKMMTRVWCQFRMSAPIYEFLANFQSHGPHSNQTDHCWRYLHLQKCVQKPQLWMNIDEICNMHWQEGWPSTVQIWLRCANLPIFGLFSKSRSTLEPSGSLLEVPPLAKMRAKATIMNGSWWNLQHALARGLAEYRANLAELR